MANEIINNIEAEALVDVKNLFELKIGEDTSKDMYLYAQEKTEFQHIS